MVSHQSEASRFPVLKLQCIVLLRLMSSTSHPTAPTCQMGVSAGMRLVPVQGLRWVRWSREGFPLRSFRDIISLASSSVSAISDRAVQTGLPCTLTVGYILGKEVSCLSEGLLPLCFGICSVTRAKEGKQRWGKMSGGGWTRMGGRVER